MSKQPSVHYKRVGILLVLALSAWIGGIADGADSSKYAKPTPVTYKHIFSTGPFGLSPGTHSLDWTVLNNTSETQRIRVSIYMLLSGQPKSQLESLEHEVKAFSTKHNANGENGGFIVGGKYEVVLETNDERVLPSVEAWSSNSATIIPGTRISPRDFVELKR